MSSVVNTLYKEIEKRKNEIESKIIEIRSTIETIRDQLSHLNIDLAEFNIKKLPKTLPDNYKKTIIPMKKNIQTLIDETKDKTKDSIDVRIDEIDDIYKHINDYDITLETLDEYEAQLNVIETFIPDWEKKINNEIPNEIKRLKEKLEQIQKSDYDSKSLLPLQITTNTRMPMDVIKNTVKSRILEKAEVYKNDVKLVSIKISLEISSNIDTKNQFTGLEFEYKKDDYIIFKKNDDINFTIGKIDLIYKNNMQPVLYIKTIDPTNALLNPWILYWVNLAPEYKIDIFTNKYEIISINDKEYNYFPLALFCNITPDIENKLNAMFSVKDEAIYKLNIKSKLDESSIFNIKTYFDDNLPFYAIDDTKIEDHILNYVKISSNFSEFLNNKKINETDKEKITKILDVNKVTVETINIQNNYFDLKTQYSELLKNMPIKLSPNVPKKSTNQNQPENEILLSDIYGNSSEAEINQAKPIQNTRKLKPILPSLGKNPLKNKTKKNRSTTD
jgi:hypothetical protein